MQELNKEVVTVASRGAVNDGKEHTVVIQKFPDAVSIRVNLMITL